MRGTNTMDLGSNSGRTNQDLKLSWHHASLTLTNRPFWIVLAGVIGVQSADLLRGRQSARAMVLLTMICPRILFYGGGLMSDKKVSNNSTASAKLRLEAKLFKGFADATRLAILEALRQGDKTVSQIVEETGLAGVAPVLTDVVN